MNNENLQVKQFQTGLWQSSFLLLLLSRFLKVMADNFALIAVVWLLIEMGGGALASSIFYVSTLVPQTMLAPFLSPLFVRGRLQSWMFASDATRGILVLIVPLCYQFDLLPIWWFFTLVILQSATGSIYNPASVALLPRIVDPARLQQANAILQSNSEVVALIGLAGAGVALTLLSTTTTLLITGVMFLLSAVLVVLIRPHRQETAQEAEHQEPPLPEKGMSYWQRTGEGFRVVRRHKLLYGMSVYALFMNIGLAPWTALAALYVAQDLQGSAATLTLLRASTSIGALLAGLLFARLKVRSYGMLFIMAGIAEGIAFSVLGFAPWMWLIVACCFVLGVTLTAINIPEVVIVQSTVPAHQQAQVYSVVLMISVLFLPIFYLISGALAQWVGIGTVITCGGIISVLAGIVTLYFTPLSKTKI